MAVISGHRASAAGAGPGGGPGGLDVACAVNAAWNALTYVRDPGLCLDVVSLGLVYDVRAGEGAIVVELALPSPASPARKALPDRVRAAVAGAVGAAAVDVRVVREPPWSPAMIDPIAAAAGPRTRWVRACGPSRKPGPWQAGLPTADAGNGVVRGSGSGGEDAGGSRDSA